MLTRTEWHQRGCIVGRGVLIDYVSYAERHGLHYSPITNHGITHLELEEAAREQAVEFRTGDILLVRSGLTKWYNECLDPMLRDRFFKDPTKASVGVLASLEAFEWVWNHHFAAVAGDALAWEPVPYPKDRPCELPAFCINFIH